MRHQVIIDLIDRMGKIDHLATYAKTLLGPRTRGSVTAKGLDVLPLDTEWIQFQPVQEVVIPGCKYYQCHCGDLIGARVGALPLQDALAQGYPVKMRNGAHGPELYVDQEVPELPSTNILTVILGPDEKGIFPEIVWTWHPGTPLASLKKGLGPWVAVKLHNG